MKFNLIIDKTKEPSVTVVCDRVTEKIKQIENLCGESDYDLLYGYCGDETVLIDKSEVCCFYTNDGKVFASTLDKEYLVKIRIKQVVDIVDDNFIKINQGCIVNVSHIKSFSASVGGALKIQLKNGFCDYVSRRELKNIKRRLNIWTNT